MPARLLSFCSESQDDPQPPELDFSPEPGGVRGCGEGRGGGQKTPKPKNPGLFFFFFNPNLTVLIEPRESGECVFGRGACLPVKGGEVSAASKALAGARAADLGGREPGAARAVAAGSSLALLSQLQGANPSSCSAAPVRVLAGALQAWSSHMGRFPPFPSLPPLLPGWNCPN